MFGFFVPFVFGDVLELPRDLFYGIYAAGVVMFVVAWATSTGQPPAKLLRRRWVLALALGLVFAGVMALIAVRTEDATARPEGIELVAAVLWRGVVYGLTDGLLLSAFPILVVFAAFAGTKRRRRWLVKFAIGLLALVASAPRSCAWP